MDSRLVLKWHLRVFQICGLWSAENGSILYSTWMIIFTTFVNIGFPLSQLICVLWVDSIEAVVNNLIIASSIFLAAIKGMNVLAKKKYFIQLLHLMKELDDGITTEEYAKIFKPKFMQSNQLLILFCANYVGSWIFVAIQVIISNPAERLWSSTYLYPNEYLHQSTIYIGGIIFQSVSNFFLVFVDVAVDTFPAILLHMLTGHIELLSKHLQVLGKDCSRAYEYQSQEKILFKLCKKYVIIIRYSEILENILSFALFAQFGVSGLVLCTCAYQLSMVKYVARLIY